MVNKVTVRQQDSMNAHSLITAEERLASLTGGALSKPALPPVPAAMPSPPQFSTVSELIRNVMGVSAVTVALHGRAGGEGRTSIGGSFRAFLECPLIDGETVLGTLRVLDTKERVFTEHDCSVLEGFARVVVDQVTLWSEASRDMLTNAMTRRAFNETLRKTFALAQRGAYRATLVVFDLDHFKAINDTHGHAAGDTVLRTVASVVAGELRCEDSFGRLGGEEFAILVGNADAVGAAGLAARVRRAIETAPIAGNPGLRVTASFGVAELSPYYVNVDQWLDNADAALYVAKSGGRNCVRIFEEPVQAIAS
jgi:diguanylate cyclase (GGDEF)-like protein